MICTEIRKKEKKPEIYIYLFDTWGGGGNMKVVYPVVFLVTGSTSGTWGRRGRSVGWGMSTECSREGSIVITAQ